MMSRTYPKTGLRWRCQDFFSQARRQNRLISSMILAGFGNKARLKKDGNPTADATTERRFLLKAQQPKETGNASSTWLRSLLRALSHTPISYRAIQSGFGIGSRNLVLCFCIIQFLFFLPWLHGQSFPTSLNPLDDINVPEQPKSKNEPSLTHITAEKESTFDNRTNIAEFFGRVTVKNDQFNLYCDHLIVTLRKDRRGMQHGEAIGNVVITQDNVDSEGKVIHSIGRSGRANYDPVTGNTLLTEWPQLQQGINNHIAVDANTRMILNKDGKSTTFGQSKTVIVDAEKKNNTPTAE